jgi:hypothetical protein
MPNKPYKMIQVGTGGLGSTWCKSFLPPHIKDGLIEVVAAIAASITGCTSRGITTSIPRRMSMGNTAESRKSCASESRQAEGGSSYEPI